MIIKRIDPMSFAKIFAVIYAAMGLILGVLFALFGSLFGRAGAGFGFASIILFPILYGVIGFIATAIMALIYNAAAGSVGGMQIDTE